MKHATASNVLFSSQQPPRHLNQKLYVLLLPYSNSASRLKTLKDSGLQISRMSLRNVCLARRCCGWPSLRPVSVWKAKGLRATALHHPDSGQRSDGQWSLEGAVRQGKLFYSVSPQDILGQREVHFFKLSQNKSELNVGRQVSRLFSMINCVSLFHWWENKTTWALRF